MEHSFLRGHHPIETLVERSQDVVFEARSVFPLDVFPDHIIIDRSKVVIVFREMLGFETEHTILLNEVRDVDAELGYFIGSLKILVSGPGVQWTSITNLRKNDARRGKQIIDGLLIAKNENCDLDDLSHAEMVKQLTALGSWNSGVKKL